MKKIFPEMRLTDPEEPEKPEKHMPDFVQPYVPAAVCFRYLLKKLEKHTPGPVKSIQLQILLNATAEAFYRPKERIWHLSAEKALAAYMSYTISCTENVLVDKKRVYRQACRLGERIRRFSGFTRKEDLERLVFYLYSNIGIKMAGHLPGEIIVPVCRFSRVYTPEQCRTMSLMDWGIISGICGGGKLVFTERLTQGCGRCRACLTQEPKPEGPRRPGPRCGGTLRGS